MPIGVIILVIFLVFSGGIFAGQQFNNKDKEVPVYSNELDINNETNVDDQTDEKKESSLPKKSVKNSPAPTYFEPPSQETSLHSEVKVEVKNTIRTITASGAYQYSNAEIKYTLVFPENGGDVTGNVSGICNGPITGRYTGGEGGEIKGVINAKCQVFLITQDLQADYTGKVFLKDGKIDISYDGEIPFFADTGSFVLTFDPVK